MSSTGITIEALEDATGVKVRQLRTWTQAGILPRPGAGRYATYPEGTDAIALKAKELYQKGLSLDAIKLTLATPETRGNAGDYLASLRRNGAFGGGPTAATVAEDHVHDEGVGPEEHVSHLVRIAVTPTVHLTAEGPLDAQALKTLRRAAAAARAVLESPNR